MNVSTTRATSNHTAGDHRDYWTRWFNVDNPAYGDGDDETTVDSIQNIYGKICENGFQILSAKCRNEGTGDVFDKDSARGNRSDVLNLDCTSEGNICKNIAQGTRQCQDYSIQFLCHYQDDSSNNSATNCFTQFDFRVYIILTAVPLLLLLTRMWWVYVYRVRKLKRRIQQTTNDVNPDNDNAADSTSIASNLRKPPPSYKELFGEKLTSDNFAISRENIIVCRLCETSRCCVFVVARKNVGGVITGISTETESSSNEPRTQIMDAGMNEESGDRITPENNGTDVFVHIIPTVSFTNECPNSVASDVSSVVPDSSNVVLATQKETQNSVNIGSLLNGQIPQIPTTIIQQNCSLFSNKKTQSNLDCLMNPSWLNPSTISHPCACLCHRTIPSQHQIGERCDNSIYAARTDSCESVISPSFPGMHIPVLDPSRVWVETHDSPSVDPEELPTYEDALILTEVKASESEQTSL